VALENEGGSKMWDRVKCDSEKMREETAVSTNSIFYNLSE